MDPHKSVSANEIHSEGLNHFGIKELLGEEIVDWGSIKNAFRSDTAKLEELLSKIHFKRKRSLPDESKSRVLNFLSIGYLSTDDVRYFNEFLWFYDENDKDKSLMEDCLERFSSNLNEKGNHRLPNQLNQYPPDSTPIDLSQFEYKTNPPLKVCLIGFPPFFGKIIKALKKEGHYVQQFFLPYHPDQRINRFLKFKLPVKVLSLLAGNFYSYRTLDFDYKDDQISQILREGNFDIGFHKLNFIIRSNIFSSFAKGLLNDHWGYLPFLRGKSTIAYSLLLNIPVIPTMHFIAKGIDSGPIAGYYPFDYSKARTVKEIRHILRKTMPERALSAIKHACRVDFTPKENKTEAGITFYEIHPWLSNHIDTRILKP